jgi:hypothetical protein
MENGNDTTKSEQELAAAAAAAVGKIEFNEAQQKHVNKLVQDRLARQEATLKTDFEKSMNEKLDALRKELAPPSDDATKTEDATKKQHRELLEAEQRKAKVEQLKAQELEKKLKDTEGTLAKRDKRDAMTKAMNGIGFHSPEEVLLLTDAAIELSPDGKGYVVRENGVIKENSSLEPMALEEFFRVYAQARPWSVNEDLVAGAGSAPGKTNVGTVRSRVDLKDAKSKSDYIDKFGYDAYEALPMR